MCESSETEPTIFYAPEEWDCESVHAILDIAVDQELDSFDDPSEIPEVLQFKILKAEPDVPHEDFVARLTAVLQKCLEEYHDGLSLEQEASCRRQAVQTARAFYHEHSLQRLVDTGDKVNVNVAEWRQQHPNGLEVPRDC